MAKWLSPRPESSVFAAARVAGGLQRRVFFHHLVQRGAELVLICARVRAQAAREGGLGEGYGRELHGPLDGAERVVRGRFVEPRDHGDVAGADGDDGLLLLAAHRVHLADVLGLAGAAVEQVRVGVQLAAIHPHVGNLAVGVGQRLEDQGGHGLARHGLERDRLAAVEVGGGRRLAGGGGDRVDDAVEQLGHAADLEGGAAEHGHDAAIGDAGTQAGEQLVAGEGVLAALQVALDQVVVGGGDLIDQLGAPLVHLGVHLAGDIGLEKVAVVFGAYHPGLLLAQRDDAAKVLRLADRDLHGEYGGVEQLARLIHATEEVGVLTIDLIDKKKPRHPSGHGLFPHLLGSNLYPASGV